MARAQYKDPGPFALLFCGANLLVSQEELHSKELEAAEAELTDNRRQQDKA